jgi:histidyl-tRNA synthetase
MTKPTLPQGTRDFGPDVVRKRSFILDTIKNVFELYGFQPLETPALENLDTLMGKYGDEGDKLIFKILNNGLENPQKESEIRQAFENVIHGRNDRQITERALKYDLTIPFARYVAMNHHQLAFPFKRYQVQPVWRADRPQRGRYREFYQCDADVVGSNSLLNEVELVTLYNNVFTKLNITGYELRLNHRKILAALAEKTGGAGKLTDITIAIDKLDKIGIEKVKAELVQKNIAADAVELIEQYLQVSGSNEEILQSLEKLIGDNESLRQGCSDLRFILDHTSGIANVKLDPTLARGLNYYTGVIFEAKAPEAVKIGSIGGGGRYDDLTGLFGVPGIPGVGISFGVDRIYDVMEEMNLFPPSVHRGTRVLFFNLGQEESAKALELANRLRDQATSAEVFHEQAKFDKQFKYAEKKQIPFIVIIGEKELKEKTCTVKNLGTGIQETIAMNELDNYSFKS